MIAFLLELLKVIGIILLVVLILLLVTVGVVLFVPIRYSGRGQITDEKKEVAVKVTWLLKALQCCVEYTFPEQPVIGIKIFGVDIMKLLEKRKEKTTAKTKGNKGRKKVLVSGVNASLLEPVEESPQDTSAAKEAATANTAAPTQSATNDEMKTAGGTTQDGDSKAHKASAESTTENKGKKNKIPLKEKIQTIIDKVKDIIYNIKYYIAILQEEDTKQFLADAWEAVLKILKSIRPQTFVVKGTFGFDTPDTTGKVYGMYAVVMPMVGQYIVLEPDFDKQVIRGEIELKGSITIFVIVVNALRIIFDKRLQPLINKLKYGGKKDGRK